MIALIIEDPGLKRIEVIRRLRPLISNGIGEANSAISGGSPVFVRKLFDRSDAAFSNQMLQFFKWLELNVISYHAYQILDNDLFDPAKAGQYYKIDATRLENMITTRKASIEEQRRIGVMQDANEW